MTPFEVSMVLSFGFVWMVLVIKDSPKKKWPLYEADYRPVAWTSTNEQQRIAFLEEELARLRAEKGYR